MTIEHGLVTLEEYGRILDAEEALLVVRSSNGWEQTCALLRHLAIKLTENEPLTDDERTYLAEALARVARDPANADVAFGPRRRKGRPNASQGLGLTAILAGRAVVKATEEGLPVDDGYPTRDWDGIGAISRVAEERKLTPDVVKRGYRKYRKQVAQWDCEDQASRGTPRDEN